MYWRINNKTVWKVEWNNLDNNKRIKGQVKLKWSLQSNIWHNSFNLLSDNLEMWTGSFSFYHEQASINKWGKSLEYVQKGLQEGLNIYCCDIS